MDKLNAILNYIFNLFKKIKITMIVGVVLLFCSTLLFVPDDILDIFGLLPIIEKYEGGIGVGFITSISYFVCKREQIYSLIFLPLSSIIVLSNKNFFS